MTETNANEPPVMAPPTETMPPEPTQRKWPTVIGIIAIVFGSLGAMQGCGGFVGILFQGMLAGNEDMPPATRAQFEVAQQFSVLSGISAVCVLGLAVLLLSAGIGLLRRRPWGRTAILAWSVGRMLYAVPASLLTYVIMRATWAAMKEAGESDPATAGIMGIVENLGAVGVGCGVLWAWAFPVFCIIWMVRAPVKAEVERWTLESRAAI